MERNVVCVGVLAVLCLAVSCGGDERDYSTGAGGSAGSAGASNGDAGDGGENDGGTSNGGTNAASGGEGPGDGNAGAGASESEGGAGGEPALPSKDVHGRITFGGVPLANRPVVVNGVITNTDDNGEFSVPDVADEYDFVSFSPEQKLAQVIEGLTTRTPVINSYLAPDSALNETATLSGALSGGAGFPNAANHRAQVAFTGDQGSGLSMLLNEGNSGSFSFSKGWYSEAPMSGTLFALQWSWGAEGLTALTGYASKPFTLEDGATYASPETDLALDEIDQRLVPVQIDWGDYVAATCYAYVGPIRMEFTPCDDSFSIPAPSALPWGNFVSVRGAIANKDYTSVQAELPATGDLELLLPKPRSQLLPLEGATEVDVETAFTWSTSEPEMIGVHQFSCDGGWEIELTSAEHEIKIPDLSEYGLSLPEAAACKWFLYAQGPALTADDALALRYAFANKQALALFKQTDSGTPRTFTTAE